MRISNYIDHTPLLTDRKSQKKFIIWSFADFFFIVFLFIMVAITATNPSLEKYKFFVVFWNNRVSNNKRMHAA